MGLRVGSVHLGVCAAGGSVQGQTENVACSQLFSSHPTLIQDTQTLWKCCFVLPVCAQAHAHPAQWHVCI